MPIELRSYYGKELLERSRGDCYRLIDSECDPRLNIRTRAGGVALLYEVCCPELNPLTVRCGDRSQLESHRCSRDSSDAPRHVGAFFGND